jgi:hypothetical protein
MSYVLSADAACKYRDVYSRTLQSRSRMSAFGDYEKAIGRPEGLAELSVFFCEEAFSFVESCSFSDERPSRKYRDVPS